MKEEFLRPSLPCGHCNGATARAATSNNNLTVISKIPHGSEERMGRIRPHAKLIHICFATYYGACFTQPLDDGGIVGAAEVSKDARGASRWEIYGADVVFDGDEAVV